MPIKTEEVNVLCTMDTPYREILQPGGAEIKGIELLTSAASSVLAK